MTLTVSINAHRVEGPFGGGNRFSRFLEDHLEAQGHEVCRELRPGLDAIVIVAAQPGLSITAYTVDEIERYKRAHPGCAVVQRMNTCDAPRAEDTGADRALLRAAGVADHNVLVSAWLEDHFLDRGLDPDRPRSVIRTGPDPSVFHPEGSATWDGEEKLRLVTHHWSTNPMKGFDVYKRIDQLLDRDPYRERFEFVYVGRTPLGIEFENAEVHEPLPGPELADVIRSCHVHVSGARHEPAGNHYIEAMACGLPVLYLDSGSLPEYCGDYGIAFDLVNFEDKLAEMRDRYPELRKRAREFPLSAPDMAEAWEQLLVELAAERDGVSGSAWRRVAWRAGTLVHSTKGLARRALARVCP